MRRYLNVAVVLLAGLLLAAFAHGVKVAQTFQTLKIGAGGFVSDIDVEGTDAVARTDTYGAYYLDPNVTCGNASASPCWRQLLTTASMPSSNFGFGQGEGVAEIRMAPSNHDRCYMIYTGQIFRTDNCRSTSVSWTLKSAFSQVTFGPNAGTKLNGPYMDIDPSNPDVMIVATLTSSVFFTTDGGTTFSTISGLAAPSGGNGSIIQFDPHSTVTGGKTQGIYIAVYGTGVYHGTGGTGGSFTLTTGTPTTFAHMTVKASNGDLWFCDNAGASTSIHKFNGTSWTNYTLITNSYNSVAVNPVNGNIYTLRAGDIADISTNDGTSWGSQNGGPFPGFTIASTDIPWLNTTVNMGTASDMKFDSSGVAYVSTGEGVFKTSSPVVSNSGLVWTSVSASIEQLVSNWIISPPGGDPLIAFWDKQVFRVTNPDVYPSSHGAVSGGNGSIVGAWSIDYASSSHGTIVCICISNIGQGDFSGISSDGGTTWTAFATEPSGVTFGGTIAASTPSIIIWVNGANGQLFETTNGGTSWTAPTITGIATTGQIGWNGAYFNNRMIVCADRVTAGQAYAYNAGGGAGFGGTSSPGFYKRSAGGGWAIALAGHIDNNDLTDAQMRCVPGVANEFLYSSGANSAPHPKAQSFYDCTDSSGTVTCTPFANVQEVQSFDLGKAKPGGSGFPSIYIYGWVTTIDAVNAGFYRSDDHGATWQALTDSRYPRSFPLNSVDFIKVVAADANTYGTFYFGFGGSGAGYGKFPYLLQRDLNPANDNAPMWINKAA